MTALALNQRAPCLLISGDLVSVRCRGVGVRVAALGRWTGHQAASAAESAPAAGPVRPAPGAARRPRRADPGDLPAVDPGVPADQASPATRWHTTLPFPVHVVSYVEVVDAISGGRLTTGYRYHHGYRDSLERELRGFAMVEQLRHRDLRRRARHRAGRGPGRTRAGADQKLVPLRTRSRARGRRPDRARPATRGHLFDHRATRPPSTPARRPRPLPCRPGGPDYALQARRRRSVAVPDLLAAVLDGTSAGAGVLRAGTGSDLMLKNWGCPGCSGDRGYPRLA